MPLCFIFLCKLAWPGLVSHAIVLRGLLNVGCRLEKPGAHIFFLGAGMPGATGQQRTTCTTCCTEDTHQRQAGTPPAVLTSTSMDSPPKLVYFLLPSMSLGLSCLMQHNDRYRQVLVQYFFACNICMNTEEVERISAWRQENSLIRMKLTGLALCHATLPIPMTIGNLARLDMLCGALLLTDGELVTCSQLRMVVEQFMVQLLSQGQWHCQATSALLCTKQ